MCVCVCVSECMSVGGGLSACISVHIQAPTLNVLLSNPPAPEPRPQRVICCCWEIHICSVVLHMWSGGAERAPTKPQLQQEDPQHHTNRPLGSKEAAAALLFSAVYGQNGGDSYGMHGDAPLRPVAAPTAHPMSNLISFERDNAFSVFFYARWVYCRSVVFWEKTQTTVVR